MFQTKTKNLFSLLITFALTACTNATTPTPLVTPEPVNIASVAPVSNVTDGEILIAPFNNLEPTKGILQILDKTGKEIKSKVTNGEATNFRKWVINGQTRYSYNEYAPAANAILSTTNIPGSVVIMDESLNELKRIRLLPYKYRTEGFPDDLDGHDFIMIDDNHYIVMAYYIKQVSNIPAELKQDPNPMVISAIIQEVENGQVLFEWASTDYPELYKTSIENNNYATPNAINDYAHLNSMIIDPTDNNLILSLRSLSQVIKIDRKTGNIIWRLGGTNSDFPLTDEQKFYFQHNVTLVDDNKTLLMFDNGSETLRPYTRIVEFKLDELNKKVNSFKAMNAPDKIFSKYMGSVQKRGDTYFIGWGTVPRISEINYKTNEMTFDMKLEKNTYRAFKY